MTLWNFALALYARAGVERACLDAQDEGADVCLLLCGSWLDARGTPYQAAGADALRRLAGDRQAALIGPLRNLRQQLRAPAQQAPHVAHLRTRIKELELAAERQLLEQLERASWGWPLGQAGLQDSGRAWLEALARPLAANHPSLAVIHLQRLNMAKPAAAD